MTGILLLILVILLWFYMLYRLRENKENKNGYLSDFEKQRSWSEWKKHEMEQYYNGTDGTI